MSSRRAYLALALAAAVTSLPSGCAERHDKSSPPCVCRPDDALSPELMSMLAVARAHHHRADLLLQRRPPQLARAIDAVRAILALKLDRRYAEAEEVRLDATARLAKLQARSGDLAGALRTVRQQLKVPARQSFYLANLHAVHGELLQQQVDRLRKSGDGVTAKETARRAMRAFETSIAINERLLRELQRSPRGAARPPAEHGTGGQR